MRPASLLVLSALLLILGSAQGWSLLHNLAYSLLLVVGLAFLWSWGSIRGLYVRPRPRVVRSQVGSYLEERSEIENQTWLPRPWLELMDAGDHPEHNLSQVLSLGPIDRKARVVRTLCRQRGQFTLGPVHLASGDPFGIFRHERQVYPPTTLMVLPATVDLPSFTALPGELPGGSLQGERVPFTTSNVATVREYQPGDGFNRIHWKTTARSGSLMVKEFERDPFSDLWLVLDLDRLAQVGRSPESTDECAVTVAASLGRHFLLQDRAVGIVTQGNSLPVDRGARQLMRVLEFLTVALPRQRQPIEQLLLGEVQRFTRRDTLVVITASTDTSWVPLCRDLARRGVRTVAVLIDAGTFGGATQIQPVIAALWAAAITTHLIQRGESLAAALARPARGRI